MQCNQGVHLDSRIFRTQAQRSYNKVLALVLTAKIIFPRISPLPTFSSTSQLCSLPHKMTSPPLTPFILVVCVFHREHSTQLTGRAFYTASQPLPAPQGQSAPTLPAAAHVSTSMVLNTTAFMSCQHTNFFFNFRVWL